MIKKKDTDITSLVRASFIEEKKKHGLLREAAVVKKFKMRPFDEERDMPKVELNTKDWRNPETPSAKFLDQVLNDLIVKGSSGTDTYKKTIEKISTVLGMKVSKEGVPVTLEGNDSANAAELLSSLQVKDIIHSIIFQSDPGAAGKMFEGFVARIMGGRGSSELRNPIQDIELQDEYISLKLLGGLGKEVKGSKFNLAVGINEQFKGGQDKGVTYLILIKSSENNPFSVKAHSFNINTKNYFAFVCKRAPQELNNKIVYEEAIKIVNQGLLITELTKLYPNENIDTLVKKFRAEGDVLPQRRNYKPGTTSIEELSFDDINRAVLAYVEEKGINAADIEDSRQKFKDFTAAILDTVANNIPEMEHTREDELAVDSFIKKYLPQLDKNSTEYVSNMFPKSVSGAKSFMTTLPDKLMKTVSNLTTLDDIERSIYFEPNDYNKQLLASYHEFLKNAGDEDKYEPKDPNDLPALEKLLANKEVYDRRYKYLTQKIININTFLNKVRNYALSGSTVEKEKEAEKTTAPTFIESVDPKLVQAFFEAIKNDGSKRPEGYKPIDKLSAGSAFELAKKIQSNYDEDYPAFYIQKEWIMMSSKKNAAVLKEVLRPIFEGVHVLKSGLEQYFTYDEVEGLSTTKEGIDLTSKAHEDLKQFKKDGQQLKASELSQQAIQGRSAGQQGNLEENINKRLTNDWSSDILDWVRKLN